MKCSNPDCNRGIGLVAYQRNWFSKQRYCSKHCRDAFVVDAPNLLKRFVVSLVAFVGLIVPLTFTMAVLAAPPARQDAPHFSGCDRNLTNASAGIAAKQALINSLSGDGPETCTAMRLYFLEVVKARAVTALCKNGTERERDLSRFDTDIANVNEAIAAHCLLGQQERRSNSTSESTQRQISPRPLHGETSSRSRFLA